MSKDKKHFNKCLVTGYDKKGRMKTIVLNENNKKKTNLKFVIDEMTRVNERFPTAGDIVSVYHSPYFEDYPTAKRVEYIKKGKMFLRNVILDLADMLRLEDSDITFKNDTLMVSNIRKSAWLKAREKLLKATGFNRGYYNGK